MNVNLTMATIVNPSFGGQFWGGQRVASSDGAEPATRLSVTITTLVHLESHSWTTESWYACVAGGVGFVLGRSFNILLNFDKYEGHWDSF